MLKVIRWLYKNVNMSTWVCINWLLLFIIFYHVKCLIKHWKFCFFILVLIEPGFCLLHKRNRLIQNELNIKVLICLCVLFVYDHKRCFTFFYTNSSFRIKMYVPKEMIRKVNKIITHNQKLNIQIIKAFLLSWTAI